jgi:NTE family protein
MRDEPVDVLRTHKSIRGLDDDQLRRLAEHVEIVHACAGDVIHHPDDHVGALFLVASGRLTLSVVSPAGVPTAFQQMRRDDQFGLLLLEQESPFPVLVTADLNTRLLRIPRDAAVELLSELPKWRRNLFLSVGPRLLESASKRKRPAIQRMIAFVHMTDETRKFTPVLLDRLSQIGEKVVLVSDHDSASESSWRTESLLDAGGQIKPLEEIRRVVGDWSQANRMIIDGHISTLATQLPTLADRCESIYWVCPTTSVAAVSAAITSLVNASPSRKEKQYVIRVLEGDEQPAQLAPELESLSQRDFKLHWDGMDAASVCGRRAGVERIVHHLRGVSVGLALGGGAARGMAHLGVLQVLQEAGIVIDRMSGTSAGALTGVLFAAGYSADFLVDAFARDLKPPWYYKLLPYGDAWYMLGKFRLGGWDTMLRNYVHSWRLEQLPIPFSSVTADLVQAQQVVRETGDATHAILESINLPVLSRPICRNGMTLVDGGIFNVVPADVLANQDANVVIASDVAARIPMEFAGNRAETPTNEMRTPSSIQTAMRIRTAQDRNLRTVGGREADVVIEPDVSQVMVTDFKRARQIAELGKQAAAASLPEIRRTLHAMDPCLFPLEDDAEVSGFHGSETRDARGVARHFEIVNENASNARKDVA